MPVREFSPEFMHATDAFVVLDSNLHVLAMNRSAERMFGELNGSPLPCGQLFGCHLADGQGLHDSTNCVGRQVLTTLAAEPYTEMNLLTRSGERVPVSVSYSPIPQADGEPHLLMVIRDLTEPQRLQKLVKGHVQQLATMQERERLAREFHDGLAQTLAYMNIQASQLDQALARGDVDTARTQLGELRLVIQSAYRDVRHALYDLRVSLDDGLGPALEAYCQSFGARNHLQMHFTGSDTGSDCLGPDQAAQVLRIVQEALTNVRKHSRAESIWVDLAVDDQTLTVTIKDNGVGFTVTPDGLAAAKPGHYGLRTMRERASGIGGTLDIRSEPGAGTEVILAVPCRAVGASA